MRDSVAQIFQCHNGGLLGLNCFFCAHCKTVGQYKEGQVIVLFMTGPQRSCVSVGVFGPPFFDKSNQLLGACARAGAHSHTII